MRNYDEPIEVSCADEAPESFRWRRRTYIVRGVIDSWVRSRPWWRYAMDPDRAAIEVPAARRPAAAAVSVPTAAPVSESGSSALLGDLQEVVWRVEAGLGRSGTVRVLGVYDLVCTGADQWRLLTVLD
ncbi:hypothetical protein BJY21_000195 [Kineosphaera limosa]|uniref:DUF6504 domain-containing protein n=1 Tax=Kineosphaera limosa NBRC 100340 TaxID=1184609 RepID=K6WEU7_9MICO|nr:DUF6504 family protein [Kineosphaera limosa]NYD99010.1 hypothetical protein [Kineosphaera limosa]GAB97785.1 hypothetical protein KILIM_082_00020 [Kineosphaera limosa NBRC 100340]